MEAVFLSLSEYFPDLMDINLTASVVILFVICIRQFLKGAPKIFSYALWGIVLLRLLVPVSIESPVSFVPERTEFSSMVEINEVLPPVEFETLQDRVENREIRENTPPDQPFVQISRELDAQQYLTLAWLAGIALMLVYSLISYGKLKRKLKVVIPIQKGVYLADDIDTPFVLGFFRPEIYLPGCMDMADYPYVIAHERHHIRRGDHIFKALGFLALTVHWFNPFVWAAFILSGRDMEMSCDEAVIRKLGEDGRAEYSAALLNLSTGRRMFSGTPLAFDEGDPTERVRNLAKWKKPSFWVILVCVIVCIVLAVCLLTDPSKKTVDSPRSFVQYLEIDEQSAVLSGISQADTISVKFKKSSGPTTCIVNIQYKMKEDDAWTNLSPKTLKVAESCVFQLPIGCSYFIQAIPTHGSNGYVTFEISDRGVYALSDIEKRNVSQIKLQNLHNGEITEISDEMAIGEICSYLDGIIGADYGSSKGYYEGTYSIKLEFSDTSEYFSLAFGDSSSFSLGMGEDGYPIRYELLSHEIQEIVAFFSQYDSSGFQWAMLGQVETTQATEPSSQWGVTITPERVSRTGATAIFNYSGNVPGEDGAELTYGDFLSLDRMDNGNWVPVDELAGYDYYVSDSSYPVVDGYGMVHEWPDRFGELADGTYRMGKLVTLTRPDGTSSQQTVYGEFTIPDSILTGPIPLEDLPEKYGAEQAEIDGCVVFRDGDVSRNQAVWQEFLDAVNAGQEAFVRTARYNYDPGSGKTERFIYDIRFDGSRYSVEGMLNGEKFRKEYQYLLKFTGEASNESQDYDSYIRYVLSNDLYESWEDANGITMDGSIKSEKLPQVVYTDLIYETKRPDLPDKPNYAVLEFMDEGLVMVLDGERLEKLIWLFESAEYVGYEPKTHSIGVGLNLIFNTNEVGFANGNGDFVIELDPDSDLCRINGEYVWYGRVEEPEYTYKLWEYLGITQWPDIVYTVCENALRP